MKGETYSPNSLYGLYRRFRQSRWWRWTWVGAFTLAIIASPFLNAELVFWFTGSAERAERALHGTIDYIRDAAMMWLVLELFVVTKARRLLRLLEEKEK